MARSAALPAGIDLYAVLKVLPTATSDEIRISFKRLVLESHPDKNPARREWSERQIRQLIQAYEVLINAESRAAFDRQREATSYGFRTVPGGGATPRRQREKVEPFFFRKKDPESRALLILHLLLNGRQKAAVEVLDEMEPSHGRTFLYDHLTREDYLDSLFLLGEFFMVQKQYGKAVRRLEEFWVHERKSRFPRHYLEEAVRRLKDLYLRKLPRHADAETALRGLRDALALKLTKSEEALCFRRMVEILVGNGRIAEAEGVIDRARARFPEGKLVSKLEDLLRTSVRS